MVKIKDIKKRPKHMQINTYQNYISNLTHAKNRVIISYSQGLGNWKEFRKDPLDR